MEKYLVDSVNRHFDVCLDMTLSRSLFALKSKDRAEIDISVRMLDHDIAYMMGMKAHASIVGLTETHLGMIQWIDAAKEWREMVFIHMLDTGYGVDRERGIRVAQ